MAWRIDKFIVKGFINNQIPGIVTGKIWLAGLNQPIELSLAGNCYRDLAGSRLIFKNPEPEEDDYSGLDIFQDGKVGDMTASKKVKALADPENFAEDFKKKDIPYTWKNCLYLEWFSESNGRVLIETTDFVWKMSLPKWSLSTTQEEQQKERNQQAMFGFMEELSNAIESDDTAFPDSGEMNEFQWEAYLQKNDVRSDMLLELFEKYEDDPNCEDIIAEAMGWDVESIDFTEDILDELEELEFEESEAEVADYEPSHPLIMAMMEITSRVFYETENRKLFTDDTTNPWNQLVWHCQLTVSKLIAALEEVSEGVDPEPGFIVATLKRALHLVHLTIATLEAASGLDNKRQSWVAEVRKELFNLRESILDLMQTYRNR